MSKLLTIVVPVYKVEQYINKCLDSCIIYTTDENGNRVLDEELMNQLEVIIVNDGTPDNSAELSREYTIRYPQTFRQIDKENGGHGSAWNVGVKEATGKYLRFLDSDDWLTNLDLLMKKLQDCEADLVFTHHNTYFTDSCTSQIDNCNEPYDVILTMNNLPIERFLSQHFYASFQRVTCRTQLLSPFYPVFTEKTRYDDSIMSVLPILQGSSFIVFDFVLYNYLIGRDGQTVDRENLLKYCEQHNAEYGKIYDFVIKYKTKEKDDMSAVLDALLFRAFSDTITIALSLPYYRRKRCVTYLKSKIPNQNIYKYSKAINRYLKWPFILAFVYDQIRRIKNQTIHKSR